VATDLLFKKLCDPLTIEIGWHLAHGDSRDDFATDPLGYADYAFMKKERFSFIVEQLRNHRYRISRLTDIDIPKSGLSVRPGNVLPIEESTVLHAIVYLIAPKIDPKLKKGVYSYRLAKDWEKRAKRAEDLFVQSDLENIPFLKRRTIRQISIEEPWYEAWPQFDAAGIRAVKEQGYTHLTKTDISAYFENIELRILDSILRRYLPRETDIIEILLRILEAWTRRTPSGVPIGRGIPQGNNVSSFLGNLYLTALDDSLEQFARKKGAKWFRYVDDVKVFTKSYEDAREAVFLINSALRDLHLNLQGSKTDILSGEDLESELFDESLDVVNQLISQVEPLKSTFSALQMTKLIRAASKVTKQFTRGLPKSVANLSGHQNRLFRRCLTLFGMARRPQLRRAAIDALRHLPDVRMLRSSLGYLTKLEGRYHDAVIADLLGLLAKGELPFPYQVACVIASLRNFSPSDPRRLASDIRKLGLTSQSHWYVRQKTLETISFLPYREKSAETLSLHALEHEHPWVRRAGASLIVRGSVEWVRRQVDALVYHPDPDVARIAMYWNRHLCDKGTANSALAGLFTKDRNERTFMRRLPMLYLLRCNKEPIVGARVLEYVREFSKLNKPIIRWHCENVEKQLNAWVENPQAS
jgi:hypothetical protein